MKDPKKSSRNVSSERPSKRMPLRQCNNIKNTSGGIFQKKNPINQDESVISIVKKAFPNQKTGPEKVETKSKQSTQIKQVNFKTSPLIRRKMSNKENDATQKQKTMRKEINASIQNTTKVTTRSQRTNAKSSSILIKEQLVMENVAEKLHEIKKKVCYKTLASTPKDNTATCKADVYDIFFDNDLHDATFTKNVKKRKIKSKNPVIAKKLKKLPIYNLKKTLNSYQLNKNCETNTETQPLQSKNIMSSNMHAKTLQAQIPTKSVKEMCVAENVQNAFIHNKSNLNTVKDSVMDNTPPDSQGQMFSTSVNSLNSPSVSKEISVLNSLNVSLHSEYADELGSNVGQERDQLVNQSMTLKGKDNEVANPASENSTVSNNNNFQKQNRVSNIASEEIDFYAEFEASFTMMHSTPEKRRTGNSSLQPTVQKRIVHGMDIAQISPICKAISSSETNKDAQNILKSPEILVEDEIRVETEDDNIEDQCENVAKNLDNEGQCFEITLFESPVKKVPFKRTSLAPQNKTPNCPNTNLRDDMDESMQEVLETERLESPQENMDNERNSDYRSIVLFEDTILPIPAKKKALKEIKEKVLKPKNTYSAKGNITFKKKKKTATQKKREAKLDRLAAALNDHFDEIEKSELCIEKLVNH